MSDITFNIKALGGAASYGSEPPNTKRTANESGTKVNAAKTETLDVKIDGQQSLSLSERMAAETEEKKGFGFDAVADPLEEAAKILDSFIPKQTPETRLQIDHDEETGRFIYKSVDKISGETVRQFPPEYMLKVLELHRNAAGLVMDDEV